MLSLRGIAQDRENGPRKDKIMPPGESTGVACPKCKSGSMVLRHSRNGGSAFFGCSRFPRCNQMMSTSVFEQFSKTGEVQSLVAVPKKFTPKPLEMGTGNPVLLEGTPQQQLIWETALDGNNVIVIAYAGTGKTTTLIQFTARVSRSCKIIYVAFNKRIPPEIRPKLPPNTCPMTIHSLGGRAVWAAYGFLKPTKYKNTNMLSDHYGLEKIEDDKEALSLSIDIRGADKIIKMCKNYMWLSPTDSQIDEIIRDQQIDSVDQVGRVYDMVRWVLSQFDKKEVLYKYSIDFEDMVLLPVIHNLPVEQADATVLDEGQDVSITRQELVKRTSDQVIIVGDPNQGINGFAGADYDSLETMAQSIPNIIHLPLTVNWRCGTKHIKLAQTLVPGIEAHPNAPEGKIYEINSIQFLDLVKPGNMVLCRTNQPMVKYVYLLIKNGIAATICGKEFGEDLILLVRRIAKARPKQAITMSLATFMKELHVYHMEQAEKLSKRRNSEKELEELNDQLECIQEFSKHVNTIEGLTKEIEKMFVEVEGEASNIVVFYTVHRSKGAENKTVFILEPRLMPHPRATSEKAIKQEINLVYVAVTRVWATIDDPNSGNLYWIGPMPDILRSKCAHLIDQL
jgi:hypothetical protein